MHTRICTCTHTYTYTQTHVHTHTHTNIVTHTQIHNVAEFVQGFDTRTHTVAKFVHSFAVVYEDFVDDICLNTHANTHAPTYTHVHTHIRTPLPSLSIVLKLDVRTLLMISASNTFLPTDTDIAVIFFSKRQLITKFTTGWRTPIE